MIFIDWIDLNEMYFTKNQYVFYLISKQQYENNLCANPRIFYLIIDIVFKNLMYISVVVHSIHKFMIFIHIWFINTNVKNARVQLW